MIAEVVHCFEDVLLVEMRVGVECHFYARVSENLAYRSNRGRESDENRGTCVAKHMDVGIIDSHCGGGRCEPFFAEEIGIQRAALFTDK